MSDTPPPPPPYLPPPPPRPGQGPVPAPPPGPSPAGPPQYGAGPVPYGGRAPSYPFPGAPMGAPTGPTRSGKALAGFVLGLATILLFWSLIVPLLALIFGLLGAKEVKRSNGARRGLGMARWGWILGLLGLIGGVALWVVVANEVAGTTAVNDLEVGQCVDIPDGDDDTVSRLDTFDCDEAHDAEVFSVGDLGNGDDPYPGLDAINQSIRRACVPDFDRYVGKAYRESDLEIFQLYPTEDNWEDDQGYVCLAYYPSGEQLTESVENSEL
ncbi:MAG: septum formation family protein [Actinobacteria bacterium]|nr:septum formation family protein [Actinomycetota bacterium]